MREIKIQVMFIIHNKDFEQEIKTHHTTFERLYSGKDKFNYKEAEILTIRQFTGFTDKNDVDIYEGDVFKCHDAIYELKRHVGGCYELHEYGNDKVFFLFNHHGIVEIIGNIHQNPDLISV